VHHHVRLLLLTGSFSPSNHATIHSRSCKSCAERQSDTAEVTTFQFMLVVPRWTCNYTFKIGKVTAVPNNRTIPKNRKRRGLHCILLHVDKFNKSNQHEKILLGLVRSFYPLHFAWGLFKGETLNCGVDL